MRELGAIQPYERKSDQRLVQKMTTTPITEMAMAPTTGQIASQAPMVQLMARVAVGIDSDKRTPTAAMKAPNTMFPTSQLK